MKNIKWLDNFGKEDNYNDYQTYAPEGMKGDGFSNVGRNSSPAWGGQFQMGGVMPGAVGHMYARIGAPSKGPRRNQTDVTDASAQNGKEMQYYQQGLDWKPKTISRDGSVIESARGQYDYPDEITRIPGSNITMKPDPKTGKKLTQPLLGISNTGERKIMYPGQDYQFEEGTEYVTEIPKSKLAKNGIRQEQKGLQNIDNLTNFTNYNTKQPGGWLDNL